MKVHEYQAKSLLKQYGVPVSAGVAVKDLTEVEKAYTSLQSQVVAVKAQIHAGGRGKGGGVKIAKSLDEAKTHAKNILGMQLKTHQTGPEGQKVRTIYLEAGAKIKQEMYLAVLLDRDTSRLLVMASAEGGMEIEELAKTNPEKIIKLQVHPTLGFRSYQANVLGQKLGLSPTLFGGLFKICRSLVESYLKTDASLLEINPLVITEDGQFLALDAKMTFDDNALYRHKDIEAMRDANEEDALELEAGTFGLNYISLNGSIGCMVNGAGLAMATMDVIKLSGGEPANFLDVGGGATEEAVTAAFKIILKDPQVKGILVNIFGGIMKCDIIANGVIKAAKTVDLKLPLVVRLQGTNAEEGKKLLAASGLKIDTADTLAEGAEKIVRLTRG